VDPFEDARLPRPLRFFAWSFPVGRAFGIPVRMKPTCALTYLLVLGTTTTMLDVAKSGLSWLVPLAYAAITWFAIYFMVLVHELGHALTARRVWKVPCDHISLSVFGGVAHLSHGAPSPKAEAVIALAGPATHALWLAALWPLREWVVPGLSPVEGWPLHPLAYATHTLWYLNLGLALFNLLPFFPLDGGRVFRALLSFRWHPNRASRFAAQVGLVGAFGVAIYSIYSVATQGAWALVGVSIAIAMAMACRNEILVAQHAEGPYSGRREAWESDPDAWKQGQAVYGDDPEERPITRPAPRSLPRRPGARGRRGATAEAPEERPAEVAVPDAARAPARSPADEAELDRLLARVTEVGLSGLTADERASLERLSRVAR